MLTNKKILFFGMDSEISLKILESLLKQNAKVSFISQNELKEVNFPKEILKKHQVKDYYSTEKIEDIFKIDLISQKVLTVSCLVVV